MYSYLFYSYLVIISIIFDATISGKKIVKYVLISFDKVRMNTLQRPIRPRCNSMFFKLNNTSLKQQFTLCRTRHLFHCRIRCTFRLPMASVTTQSLKKCNIATWHGNNTNLKQSQKNLKFRCLAVL